MTADWFYSVGDTRQGPVTEDDLKRLVTEGTLKPTDLVWQDGMPDWVEARTVAALFPPRAAEPARIEDRPTRRRDEDYDRPSRRRDDDFDRDRPSRQGRQGRRRDDDYDPDDDRPRVRRREDDYGRDDDYDRPRRKRNEKPGQVQSVAIMMLVGGILGIIMAITVGGFTCCIWPVLYFELVWGILAIIRGINMMNQDDQGPPRTLAILQIITILNGDIINCVLGIVSFIMLNDPKVEDYYRKRGFI